MPIQLLRVAAWAAQNVAVPVLEWALSKAGAAVQRHEAAKAKKKGAQSAGTDQTPQVP